ncbi:SRPBCC domain-containing protein [Jatrophihabitans telluris]|uniref:SRPBCC domain-containing protein n=1 Tax=Jatrophihabitans telluris TaxID=2038343 RepID=A0ABY4R5K7_9ACTN|nr:SRPBCC family protein [Jatrophihabitans telluris]UQX90231.1 SRPBCC domain-containing protein [Jatrophihabitans telluris]
MQLEHAFTVPVPPAEAWTALMDIERVAGCMPGAVLESVDGDEFTGSVKVRLGPIGLTYKGKASFTEKDERGRRAVIVAQGRDARGNGTASATVTATLLDQDGGGTRVTVATDLNITGKPAQFGRGVMADVGNKLIGQFADCLADKLGSGPASDGGAEQPVPGATSTEPQSSATSTEPAAVPPARTPVATAPWNSAAEPAPIDLLASAGPALAKRLLPLAIPVLALVWWIVRRHRG